MEEWLECWLPGLEKDDRRTAVFATATTDSARIVSPAQFRADLLEEMEKYG